LVTGQSAGNTGIVATSEGKSSTANILVKEGLYAGPAGGQATAAGGNVTLVVPPQALVFATPITIAAYAAPPDPKLVPGTAFEFGPEGTQFNQPVTVRIKYSASQVPSGVSPDQLRLGRLIGNTWTEVSGSSADPLTQSVTGQTNGFSVYGVVVSVAPVASVEVSPISTTLGIGATTQLSATLRDAANNILTGRTVTWTSANSAIVSVGAATGIVTGVAVGGPVAITAMSEGISGSSEVTVAAAVASVTVVPGTASLQVGQTIQLTAVPRDVNNNPLTDRPVTWSSTNSAIASVSPSGLVTGVSSGGPISILATSDEKSGSAQVTVNAPIATVDIVGATRVKVGDQYTYSADPRDAQGNVLVKQVTWTILEPSKGTMSSGGVLVPSQAGTITVRAIIDGMNWDQLVTAYDWTVNGLSLQLEADNSVTGSAGPEYLRLGITCDAGSLRITVSSVGFVISPAVQYRTNGPLVSENWAVIDNGHSLQRQGTSADQKTLAQNLAAAPFLSWVFSAGASSYGLLFRLTKLSGLLPPVLSACP